MVIKDIGNIYYNIDHLDEQDFHFFIKGWIFSETLKITGLSLLISQGSKEFRSDLFYGIERPDVIDYYKYKNSLLSGFFEAVDIPFAGNTKLKLIVSFADGYLYEIELGEFQFRESFLQSFRSIFYRNRVEFLASNNLKLNNERKVALYTHSSFNSVVDEIKILLIEGFLSLHYEVLSLDETSGFDNNAFVHIVIEPSQFFGSGNRKSYFKKPSNRLILVTTEQLSSEWYRESISYFAQAIEIWDINHHSWKRIHDELDFVQFLPLGYVENSKALDEVLQLPHNYFTCFLDEKIRTNSYLHSDFEKRPIDVLFIGQTSPRRQHFFTKNASFFSKYNCYFHFTGVSYGHEKATGTIMDAKTLVALAQRSKIILNIHESSYACFDWHRMILHGIWQRALMISELLNSPPPFIPGEDFVEATLEDLPGKIEFYLSSEAGKEGAKKIIFSSFHKLKTKCDLSSALFTLMNSLEPYQMNNLHPALISNESRNPIVKEVQVVTICEKKSDLYVDITVIITLYNYAHLVQETLNSLLIQSHNFFDLVIVDDCSTDQSLQIAETWLKMHGSFFNRYKLLHNNKNHGLGVSRNVAFRHTSTPYVFVLDADNIIYPWALEKLLSGLKNSKAAFSYSYSEHFGNRERLVGLLPWNPGLLDSGNFIDAMVMMRKEIWQDIGGYAEDMPYNGLEDYELWFKIAEAKEWGILIPEILCRYRVHDHSMLSSELSSKSSNKINELINYLKNKYTNFWNQHTVNQLSLYNDTARNNSPSSPPLISVIIPSYNHGHIIMDAIDSVRKQNYQFLEIVVVDDGSTDNTRDILSKLPDIHYIYQPNKGSSAARNTGIQNSKGDYLVFLDADDWLLPGALETNIKYLQQDNSLAFVSGAYSNKYIDSGEIENAIRDIQENHYWHLLHINYIGMIATVLFRRWVFNEFEYDVNLKMCQDYDLYLRIARKYPVSHHTQLIALYRIHDKNKSRNIPLMLNAALKVLGKQKGSLKTPSEKKAFTSGQKTWKEYYCTLLYKRILSKKFAFNNKAFLTLLLYRPKLLFKLIIKIYTSDLKRSN